MPPVLGDLRDLEELYLSDNDLTGPLPPELGNLRRLELLDLRRNTRLSGEILRCMDGPRQTGDAGDARHGSLRTRGPRRPGLARGCDESTAGFLWLVGRLPGPGCAVARIPGPACRGQRCAVARVPDRPARHGGGSPARASHLLPGWERGAPAGDPGHVHPGPHRHRRGLPGQVGPRRCSRVGVCSRGSRW